MRIITLAAIKGGVGKTTITYNFGEWLAQHGSKVLLIDLDHQCNLSQTYNVYETEGTVGNIFKLDHAAPVKIQHVKPNIDLIAGDMNLDDLQENIENRTDKNMMLYLWLAKNMQQYSLKQYDYCLIDTHPDFSTATKNAVIVSHDVISPITPSEHGYNAKWNLKIRFDDFKKEAIDYKTMDSLVTAKLYFLANMVRKQTRSSKTLLNKIKEDHESIIGILPEKELFNRSTLDKRPISEMEKQTAIFNKNKDFFHQVDQTFTNLKKRL